MLCAHGWAGQTQLSFRWRISQSEIRKIATAKKEAAKARAGKNSFPPTPFLPVRSFNEGGPFCPPERSVWRGECAISSVQKRFGFRQTNAQKNPPAAAGGFFCGRGGTRTLKVFRPQHFKCCACTDFATRPRPGRESNPRIRVLQTLALPLGYQAPLFLLLSGIFCHEFEG